MSNVSSNLFQIAPSTVFLRFSCNLAYMIYVPVHKQTVAQIFKILITSSALALHCCKVRAKISRKIWT